MPKRISAAVQGSTSGTEVKGDDPKLCGNVNEASIEIEGISTNALLDTGSCISTMSKVFYDNNLKGIELKPLNHLLHIECADGSKLPYDGYIEADISSIEGIQKSTLMPCLFLITPETSYSNRTPILLGTNILSQLISECKNNHGEKYLQTAKLHTPWYLAFRCISIREKELRRNKDRLAIIRSAQNYNIILGPNETINVKGYTYKEIDHATTCAMLQETEESNIPTYIDITPTVIQYDNRKNTEVMVNLSNLTTNTVVISPKSILCEIQPVKIDTSNYERHSEDNADEQHNVLDDIHIETNLTEEQTTQIKEILTKHKEIFSTSDIDIGLCNRVKHRIDLIDHIPFKQKHRRIPPHMIDEVREHLEQLLDSGVIQRSRSPWCSNVV